jgi:hypothetical protein
MAACSWVCEDGVGCIQKRDCVCVDAIAEKAKQLVCRETLVLICRRMVRVWGRKQRQGCGRPIPALPRAAVALSSPDLFLEHVPHSALAPPHQPRLPTPVISLQPLLRHAVPANCCSQSHRTCPAFPASVRRRSLLNRTVAMDVSPLPAATAQPPRSADRPTHHALSSVFATRSAGC